MRRIPRSILAGAALLAFAATSAAGQTIGFKLGASLSTLSVGGSTEGFNYSTGFTGGGFIRFDLGRIGVQPEILTVTKGAKFEGGPGDDEAGVNIEYVAVPVLLHVPLMYGQSFAPYVFGGPEIAFDIGCEQDLGPTEVDCEDPAADEFQRKSIDFGLTAGGGLAFAMGPGALLLEGRYTWGLTNIQDIDGEDEVKNRSAYIMAGYSIPLGRRY